MDLRESFWQVTWLSLELTISLCPIVENMAGSSVKLRPRLIVHTAPRAHQSNCAQGSSVELRPWLIRRSAPGRIRRTAPGRKWAHPVPRYTSTWQIRLDSNGLHLTCEVFVFIVIRCLREICQNGHIGKICGTGWIERPGKHTWSWCM